MAEKQKTFEIGANVILPVEGKETNTEACIKAAKKIKSLGIYIDFYLPPIDPAAE